MNKMRICCKGIQIHLNLQKWLFGLLCLGQSKKNLQEFKVNVSDTCLALGFGMPVDLRTCHWYFSSLFILCFHSSHHQSRNFPFCSISGCSKLVTSNLACCSAEKKSVEGRRNCCKSLFSCSSSHWLWLPSPRQPC